MNFKKPDAKQLEKQLTPEQFKVTQKSGTERPFQNPYWDNKDAGIYVDVVSGEPLFSSIDKFDSGTGWPSFTRPLETKNIVEKADYSLFGKRTEVRSKYADSHLGHVFDDGPRPTGQRYCMNSAAMRFVPVSQLAQEGYGEYLPLFGGKAANLKEKASSQIQTAVFAGGCFWCMEPPFAKANGVIEVKSGYTGGTKKEPTYEEVSSGTTGHAEAVEVKFDSSKITYKELLAIFWRQIDPTTPDQQFCDHGHQYRSAIFFLDEPQKKEAEESKLAIEKSGKIKQKIVTEISAAQEFYPAEEYHQDYYKKNPVRYKLYRYNCGRDRRLKELWGK